MHRGLLNVLSQLHGRSLNRELVLSTERCWHRCHDGSIALAGRTAGWSRATMCVISRKKRIRQTRVDCKAGTSVACMVPSSAAALKLLAAERGRRPWHLLHPHNLAISTRDLPMPITVTGLSLQSACIRVYGTYSQLLHSSDLDRRTCRASGPPAALQTTPAQSRAAAIGTQHGRATAAIALVAAAERATA